MMLPLALASLIVFGHPSMTTQAHISSEASASVSRQATDVASQTSPGHPSVAARPQSDRFGKTPSNGDKFGKDTFNRPPRAPATARALRGEGQPSATSSAEGSASHLN